MVGGVRSLLVIPQASDSDFGLYNCTFTNAYGSDSAAIILQKQSKYRHCSNWSKVSTGKRISDEETRFLPASSLVVVQQMARKRISPRQHAVSSSIPYSECHFSSVVSVFRVAVNVLSSDAAFTTFFFALD